MARLQHTDFEKLIYLEHGIIADQERQVSWHPPHRYPAKFGRVLLYSPRLYKSSVMSPIPRSGRVCDYSF